MHIILDARWFTREEVLSVLNSTDGAPKEAPKWDSAVEETAKAEETTKSQNEPLFKGPPHNAMAGVLINDWARGKVGISERYDGDLV